VKSGAVTERLLVTVVRGESPRLQPWDEADTMRDNPPTDSRTGVMCKIVKFGPLIPCCDGVPRLWHGVFDPRTLRVHSPPGKKAEPSPRRNTRGDANRGTQSAEYPTVEARTGIRAVETPGVSGWGGPIDRAVRVETHVRGRNRTATHERPTRKRTCGPRKRAILNSPSGNPTPSGVGGGQLRKVGFLLKPRDLHPVNASRYGKILVNGCREITRSDEATYPTVRSVAP
jgi:hypothetical protein